MNLVRMAVMLVGAGLMVGCGDDGTSPADLTLADLVGGWTAGEFEFTDQSNPAQSIDLIALGGEVALSLASNGSYTIVMLPPLSTPDVTEGSATVEGGLLVVTDDEAPGETVTFTLTLSGNTLTIETDEVEFDFGGGDVPADLRAVFSVPVGTAAVDLLGSWEATEWRYVSDPSGADTVDVIGDGGSLAITVAGDATYSADVTVPGELPDTETGVLMIVEDVMLLIDDIDPVDPMVYTFVLSSGTISLDGDGEIDFDDPPDGITEPANIEMVLQLQ